MGGKIRARALLLTDPTSEIKSANLGIPIASAPKGKKKQLVVKEEAERSLRTCYHDQERPKHVASNASSARPLPLSDASPTECHLNNIRRNVELQ